MTGRGMTTPRPKRDRMPFFVALGVVLIALVDSTRRFNGQGALTVLVFALAFVAGVSALLTGPSRVRGRVMPPGGLVLFLLWAGLTMLYTPALFEGTQNLLVYAIFVFTIAITAAAARPAELAGRVLRGYRAAGVVVAVVYLVSVLRYGLNNNDGAFYTARAAAGALILPIVAGIALRRTGSKKTWPIVLAFVGVAATLSRGLLGDALVVMTLGLAANSKSKVGAAFKFLLLAGGGMLMVYEAYQHFTPFRDRFLIGDNYQIGGFTLGTSGRANLWSVTWQHFLQSPVWGHGIGSAEQYVYSIYPPNMHPHSDYLRILHDMGVVGMALAFIGGVAIWKGCRRRYKAAHDPEVQALHLAALLGFVALLIDMVYDNPVTAIFVMQPLAVLVGLSQGLGHQSPADDQSGQQTRHPQESPVHVVAGEH